MRAKPTLPDSILTEFQTDFGTPLMASLATNLVWQLIHLQSFANSRGPQTSGTLPAIPTGVGAFRMDGPPES